MNHDQLYTFIIAAKHLNFSETARELYITQPAVSHQITTLENELGATLFNRNTRNISLTKSGELFLDDAKRILDMEEVAKDHLHLAEENPELTLRIAYLLAPCHAFLPSLIRKFRRQYPQADLEIHRMDAYDISAALAEKEYDLYFSLTRDLESQPEYSHRKIFNDTFCLICPDDHPCATTGRIDFDKLASEPLLTIAPDVGPYMAKQIQRICRSRNYFPHTVQVLDSMEEILFEVESGLGVTILPAINQTSYPSSLTYIPLDGIYTQLSISAAWLHTSENPAVTWFLKCMEQ